MTLTAASAYFDRTRVTDSTTGAFLFLAQIDPFEESRRDAASGYRRTLSTSPDSALPASKVVRALGQDWLVGQEEPDGWGDLHRAKYVLAPAKDKLKVSTLGQFLTGVSSQELFANAQWVKDVKEEEVSSNLPSMFDVFLPQAVAVNSVLWDDTRALLVTACRLQASGLYSAFCLLLENSVATATLTSRSYSPTAGAYVSGAQTTEPVLVVRWQSLFSYGSQADARFQEGDFSLVLPVMASVDTATSITLGAQSVKVLSVDDLAGVKVAHCRRG